MEPIPPGEGAAGLIRKLDLFVHRNVGREREREKKTPTTIKTPKPTPLLHFPSKPFYCAMKRLFMLREMNPDLQR